MSNFFFLLPSMVFDIYKHSAFGFTYLGSMWKIMGNKMIKCYPHEGSCLTIIRFESCLVFLTDYPLNIS